MSCSQKRVVITLIEKKEKDRTFIENWRPISLANVDAKIMSKVIASRIKKMFYLVLFKLDTLKTVTLVKQ